MSKVSFRARALDATKPMPVYKAEEIPDLPDFATINRSVPQMPTGMEKEEETEHHLQAALSAQQVYGTSEALVIPIPQVDDTAERYDGLYKDDFKTSKQYIHIQAFGMDQEIPDYDMDSEDEQWLNEQEKKMEITANKFEEMMDRLEKGSGQQVVTLPEAKLLLKEDDDLIIAVYDYWLNKRLRTQHPLIMTVKTEKRDGSTTNNPYVAFRRRTEKMQTRKNRKNDETSYEKMLKLRRDLSRAVTLLEFVKRREKSKKEMLQLTIEILEKRYNLEDFDAKLLTEAESIRHKLPPFIPPYTYKDWGQGEEVVVRKKREYRKRKHKTSTSQSHNQTISAQPNYDVDIMHHADLYSSEEEGMSPVSPSDHEDENDPDGMFAFRRKRNCHYYAPILNRLGNWSWCSPEDGGLGEKKYRYSLASLSQPQRCIGFARRRVGRGGRVLIDRAFTPWDDGLNQVDLSSSAGSCSGALGSYVTHIRDKKIPHFRPHTPPPEDPSHPFGSSSFTSSQDTTEFNMESFQSHKEQLLQMQRDQQEQLLRQQTCDQDNSYISLEHSFSSQPTSRFTLDSDSAKFAVSAVMNSEQLQTIETAVSTEPAHNGATTPTPPVVGVTNGPVSISTEGKPGFSTSPAANILQLNFPLNNNNGSGGDVSIVGQSLNMSTSSLLSSLSSATFSSLSSPVVPTQIISSSTSSSSSSVTSSAVLSSINTLSSNTFKTMYNKLATHSPTVQATMKQNHEDSKALNNLNRDAVMAMDVT